MLEACRRVERYTRDKTLDQFLVDDYFRSAVERQIEIIGEAARGMSQPFRDAHHEGPWRPIIAQRHVLAHEYGEIQPPLIWRVATEHVPRLAAQLRALLPDAG